MGTLLITEAAKLSDQRGEALAVDELHRVIVHAALATDRVHRHDSLVLHMRSRQCLGLEALEAALVNSRGEGEHLEGDPPPKRDLFGLVDDPHATTAHLAQQTEVAEFTDPLGNLVWRRARQGADLSGAACPRGAEGCRKPRHLVVTCEKRLQVRPKVGVLSEQPAPIGRPSRLECLDIIQKDLIPAFLPFGVVGEFTNHGPTPPSLEAARGAALTRGRAGRRRPGVFGRSLSPHRRP